MPKPQEVKLMPCSAVRPRVSRSVKGGMSPGRRSSLPSVLMTLSLLEKRAEGPTSTTTPPSHDYCSDGAVMVSASGIKRVMAGAAR
jgi:hypothetical protein